MNVKFNKSLFLFILGFLSWSININAQCTNTSAFGTATAPTTPTAINITTCAFAGEYSTVNSAVSGRMYTFNATGGAGNYITIRQGTSSGAVLGFGTPPLTVTCTASGSLFLHYNLNAACGSESACRTGTVSCSSCAAPTPPANDACANATLLSGCSVSLTSQTNVNSTNDAFPTCNLFGILATGAPNVWYRFIGTGNSTTITTCSSPNFDTEIGVFTGTCGSLVCLTNSDDDDEPAGCGIFDETVIFNTTLGTTYYVMIQGNSSATGTYTLSYSSTAPTVLPVASVTQPTCTVPTGSVSVTTPAPASGISYTLTGTSPVVAAQTNTTGSFTNLLAGTYSLTYSLSGCASLPAVITINTAPTFTAPPLTIAETSGTANDGTVCSGSSVTLTASGGGTYAWSTGATSAAINFNPTFSASFTVTVTATNGCTGTQSSAITVLSLPTITPTLVQPTTCVATNGSISISVSGGSTPYTYAWSTPNGTPITAPSAQNQSNLAVGTYFVTVTSANGCSQVASFDLVGPGNCGSCPLLGSLTISGAAPNCPGNSKTLTVTGLTNMNPTYGIQFVKFAAPTATPYVGGTVLATVANSGLSGGGTTASSNVIFPVAETTVIYAILSPLPTNAACRPSSNASITINPLPVVAVTTTDVSGIANNDGIICQGATATLGTAATGTYVWSNGAATQTITVGAAGTYTITVTNASGCTASSSAAITVNPVPTSFNVLGSATLCIAATGVPVSLSGSQVGVSYQLVRNNVNVGTPLAGTGAALTFPNQTVIGTYTVVGTNTTTGCVANMTGSAVVIADTQLPGIVCPANIVRNVDPGQCSALITFTAPVGTDNCPTPTTLQIAGVPTNTVVPVGPAVTNTFRVTDINGNTATCSFTVTVIDNILPTITCPANITLSVDAATCSKTVTYLPPVGTDNCPNPVTTQIAGFANGASVGPGVYTNTFRVTDAAANTATCSFTATILGNAPIITCPGLIIVNNAPGLCGAFVNFAATVQANLFPPATITYSSAPGSFFAPGFSEVTATATNSCGTSTCKFGILVNISADPELAAAYTVIANNYVGMVKNNVKSGGVGVIYPNGVVDLENNTDITTSTSFVKSLVLYQSGGSTVANHIAGNVAAGLVPPFLFTSPATINSVFVPDNTTKILNLNSYGDIVVGRNATAIFTGNTQVKIGKLKMSQGARLQFSQSTYITVKGLMEVGPQGTINIGSTNLVNFYVEDDVTIKSSAKISANIHSLRLFNLESSPADSPTSMRGLFVGHQINAEDNVEWSRNVLNCQINFGSKPSSTQEDEQGVSQTSSRNIEKLQGDFVVYPNPVIEDIRIEYNINKEHKGIMFKLYDINGRIVANLRTSSNSNTTESLQWNVQNLPSGIYQLTMEVDSEVIQRRKVSIIK